MSESISIGTVHSGQTIIGGTGATITGHGEVNVYCDQLAGLRALMDELVKAVNDSDVPPEVRDAAESAREEAAKPAPEPGRLRALVERVRSGAEGIAAVTQAALNVLGIITMMANVVR